MKAKKQRKSTKGLKSAKKLEAQKPLLTYNLTEVYIKSQPISGHEGGSIPGGES